MATSEIIKADIAVEEAILPKEFKGYTMDELRYHKALAALRKEFCKSKVINSVNNLQNPFGNSKMTKAAKALPYIGSLATFVPATTTGSIGKTLFKTVTGRIKPMDIVFLGISLIPPAYKLIKKFRKKKKKKA